MSSNTTSTTPSGNVSASHSAAEHRNATDEDSDHGEEKKAHSKPAHEFGEIGRAHV